LAASPKKSIASASSDTDPEVQLAAASAKNMTRLTASAIQSARRNDGSGVGAEGAQQDADTGSIGSGGERVAPVRTTPC
jgi:hypothetical protein